MQRIARWHRENAQMSQMMKIQDMNKLAELQSQVIHRKHSQYMQIDRISQTKQLIQGHHVCHSPSRVVSPAKDVEQIARDGNNQVLNDANLKYIQVLSTVKSKSRPKPQHHLVTNLLKNNQSRQILAEPVGNSSQHFLQVMAENGILEDLANLDKMNQEQRQLVQKRVQIAQRMQQSKELFNHIINTGPNPAQASPTLKPIPLGNMNSPFPAKTGHMKAHI